MQGNLLLMKIRLKATFFNEKIKLLAELVHLNPYSLVRGKRVLIHKPSDLGYPMVH